MAIDGESATAWSVGDHGDPRGAVIRLSSEEPIGELVLHQIVPGAGGRQISAIDVVTGGTTVRAELTADSTTESGQRIGLDAAPSRTVDIVIAEVTAGDPGRSASRAGVGFTEISTGLGPTTEFIRPPVETLQRLTSDQTSMDVVLTRERVEATSTWRSDPEPALQRILPLSVGQRFDVEATVRLNQRSDDAQLADVLGDEGAAADRRLPGVAHRGSAAVDDDITTAWLTPIDDLLGATLTVSSTSGPIDELDLVQPTGAWSTITELVVTGPDGSAEVAVPPPDAGGRSVVAIPDDIIVAHAPFALTISDVSPLLRIERRYGDEITMPAGIAELTGTTGIDPLRLAPDRLIGRSCDTPLLTVDGTLLPLAFTATASALLEGRPARATLCGDDALAMDTGEHTIVDQSVGTGFTVDRVVLSSVGATANEVSLADPPSAVVVTGSDTRRRDLEVDCPQGCWLVFGMGHNAAWSAAGPSGDLGAPEVVDGGFNGWWIDPTDGPEAIRIRWTAQRIVTIGLAVSLAAIIGCILVLIAARRRRTPPLVTDGLAGEAVERSFMRDMIMLGLIATGVALLVTPFWATIALAIGACELTVRMWVRPVPLLAIAGIGAAVYVAVAVAFIERRDAPFPGAGWTTSFEHLNGLALSACALVVASALLSPVAPPRNRPQQDQ